MKIPIDTSWPCDHQTRRGEGRLRNASARKRTSMVFWILALHPASV